jgi:hypothetical protein
MASLRARLRECDMRQVDGEIAQKHREKSDAEDATLREAVRRAAGERVSAAAAAVALLEGKRARLRQICQPAYGVELDETVIDILAKDDRFGALVFPGNIDNATIDMRRREHRLLQCIVSRRVFVNLLIRERANEPQAVYQTAEQCWPSMSVDDRRVVGVATEGAVWYRRHNCDKEVRAAGAYRLTDLRMKLCGRFHLADVVARFMTDKVHPDPARRTYEFNLLLVQVHLINELMDSVG